MTCSSMTHLITHLLTDGCVLMTHPLLTDPLTDTITHALLIVIVQLAE
jgi:hypothetical protein